jgi:glycine/D-amino acid oxidase-like deaminating enzyme
MTRLYHPAAFDPTRDVDSHWRATAKPLSFTAPELVGDQRAEIAVIGAGFTGLWAAKRLAERHGQEVAVIDAGQPAWGASGRNGGFCCMGSSKLGIPEMFKRYGEAETLAFMRLQQSAIEEVAAFLDERGEEADRHSDGELALAHKQSRVEELKEERDFLKRHCDIDSRFLSREELRQAGAHGPEFHAGLHIKSGFGLHPLKYARSLAEAAKESGVTFYGDSEVTQWRADAGRHRLITAKGSLSARKVILATNGYSREDIPGWLAGKLLPALSSIIVTRPLSDEEQRAQGWTTDLMSFDTRKLLHYFRKLPDGRFLFGGRGGLDASPEGLARREEILRGDFDRMFPEWRGVETERFWSGFVCLTYDLVPYVLPIDGLENAWTGLAFHGNGVAMTGVAGRALADMAMGEDPGLPAVLRGPARRFPLPFLRKTYLRGAYVGYGIKDRLL